MEHLFGNNSAVGYHSSLYSHRRFNSSHLYGCCSEQIERETPMIR